MRSLRFAAAATLLVLTLAGCTAATPASPTETSAPVSELRIGYFPNLTHAPAMVMLDKGYLAKELGAKVTITPVVFAAGPAAIEGMFANAVDMTFIGPNPTITGYVQSGGVALHVVAGAASGGAGLVVRNGIDSYTELKGAKIASPQLGNTQDVALRYWLKQKGFTTDTEGGGEVHVMPQDNATALQAFISGQIDGAWVPEPWLTRFVAEGKGHILVNEASLWPDGKFVVTNLISSTTFSKAHPDAVKAVIRAELDALEFMSAHPDEAKAVVNNHLKQITGKGISANELDTAWSNIEFTADPLPATLVASAAHAAKVGLLDKPSLDGLYQLGALNALLKADGESPVTAP